MRQFKTIRCLYAGKTLGRHQTPPDAVERVEAKFEGSTKIFGNQRWLGNSHSKVHGMAFYTQAFRSKTVQTDAVVTRFEAY